MLNNIQRWDGQEIPDTQPHNLECAKKMATQAAIFSVERNKEVEVPLGQQSVMKVARQEIVLVICFCCLFMNNLEAEMYQSCSV